MANVKIKNLPLAEKVNPEMKLPTGGYGDYAISVKQIIETFDQSSGVDAHIKDKSNPHSVTKEQVGLENVDNTSDLKKPISEETALALTSLSSELKLDSSEKALLAETNSKAYSDLKLLGKLDTSGNAASATKWSSEKVFTFIGGVTGSISIDGSVSKSATLSIAPTGVSENTYDSDFQIPVLSVASTGQITNVNMKNIRNATTSISGLTTLDNTLTSTSTTKSLTAAMGKKLQDEKLSKTESATRAINSDNSDRLTTGFTVNGVTIRGVGEKLLLAKTDAANIFTGKQTVNGGLEVTGQLEADIKPLLNASGEAPIYACRAWLNAIGGNSPSIRQGGNIASISKVATGEYRMIFSTPVAYTYYSVVSNGINYNNIALTSSIKSSDREGFTINFFLGSKLTDPYSMYIGVFA